MKNLITDQDFLNSIFFRVRSYIGGERTEPYISVLNCFRFVCSLLCHLLLFLWSVVIFYVVCGPFCLSLCCLFVCVCLCVCVFVLFQLACDKGGWIWIWISKQEWKMLPRVSFITGISLSFYIYIFMVFLE